MPNKMPPILLEDNSTLTVTALSRAQFSSIPRLALREISLANTDCHAPLLASDPHYVPKLYAAHCLLNRENDACRTYRHRFYFSFRIDSEDAQTPRLPCYYLTLYILANSLVYDWYQYRRPPTQQIMLPFNRDTLHRLLLSQCRTHLAWVNKQTRPPPTFHDYSIGNRCVFGYNPENGYFTEHYPNDRSLDLFARLLVLERKLKAAQKAQGDL